MHIVCLHLAQKNYRKQRFGKSCELQAGNPYGGEDIVVHV